MTTRNGQGPPAAANLRFMGRDDQDRSQAMNADVDTAGVIVPITGEPILRSEKREISQVETAVAVEVTDDVVVSEDGIVRSGEGWRCRRALALPPATRLARSTTTSVSACGSPTPRACRAFIHSTLRLQKQAVFGAAGSSQRSAVPRGVNSSHVPLPRIGPRTSLHPPKARRGNMYLQWSHRTAGVGAGR